MSENGWQGGRISPLEHGVKLLENYTVFESNVLLDEFFFVIESNHDHVSPKVRSAKREFEEFR